MDSPVMSGIENVAGRGVGLLAGLASIKGGGLLNYMMQRERMMNDPSFRAGLQGSPFAAGLFGIGGGMQPAAGPSGGMPSAGGVTPPGALFGPPAPGETQMPGAPQMPAEAGGGANIGYVPGYVPGQLRQWQPDLPPYSPDVALEQQAKATLALGVRDATSDLARGQAKIAAGIMPSASERNALIGTAKQLISDAGPGSTVKVDIPGMPMEVGSPYNLAPVSTEEYATQAQAAALAAARGTDWQAVQTNRGTWIVV